MGTEPETEKLSDEGRVLVKITHEHVDPPSEYPEWSSYHEWWNTGTRLSADRRGRPNPKMNSTAWSLWQCNNTDCPAQAIVHDDAIRVLLDAASESSS